MNGIVLIGSNGMLGHDLKLKLSEWQRDGVCQLDCPSSFDLDISNGRTVANYLMDCRNRGYDTVINCAAMTDVYRIETDDVSKLVSYRVNALGPKYLAETCSRLHMGLVHFSTDYVYSQYSTWGGMSNDEFPVNSYGQHKLFGELFIKEAMRTNYTIFRIGCLYGIHREKSFIHKFLRNLCRSYIRGERQIRVGSYQESTPTSTNFVCGNVIPVLLNNTLGGTVTLSPGGSASRYEFANELAAIMKFRNVLGKLSEVEILPDDSEVKYLPSFSVMNALNGTSHLGASLETWQKQLDCFVKVNLPSLKDFIEKIMNEESQKTERESGS